MAARAAEPPPSGPGARPRTVLGFDYGLRRIGVAVGETLTGTARPLAVIAAGRGPDWPALDRLIAEWRPDALVVGIPYNLDGSPHAMTRAAERFARRLAARYRLPVHRVDERLSTAAAREAIRAARAEGRLRRGSRGARDRVAAQVVLEAWLAEAARGGEGE